MNINFGTALSIVGSDIAFSFDNSAVNGAIAENLRKWLRLTAIVFGLAAALIIRLAIIYLCESRILEDFFGYKKGLFIEHWGMVLAGMLFLGWLTYGGVKEYFAVDEPDSHNKKTAVGFWQAVWKITVTDFFFSIDNILVVMAITKDFNTQLVGLLLSVALMMFFTFGFSNLMEKVKEVKLLGFILLGTIAFKMFIELIAKTILADTSFAHLVHVHGEHFITACTILIGVFGTLWIVWKRQTKNGRLA